MCTLCYELVILGLLGPLSKKEKHILNAYQTWKWGKSKAVDVRVSESYGSPFPPQNKTIKKVSATLSYNLDFVSQNSEKKMSDNCKIWTELQDVNFYINFFLKMSSIYLTILTFFSKFRVYISQFWIFPSEFWVYISQFWLFSLNLAYSDFFL